MNTCLSCGGPVARYSQKCQACRWGRADALIDKDTRYAEDAAAIEFVETHPGGGTLEEVGELMGLTRERIRQIEERALRKLVDRLKLVGVTASDVADTLAGKASLERRSA